MGDTDMETKAEITIKYIISLPLTPRACGERQGEINKYR